MDYSDLRERLRQEGLFQKRPGYYLRLMAAIALGIAGALTVVAFSPGNMVLLVDALFLGFLTVQVGFLMHDASHRCLFRAGWKNELVGLIVADLLNGVSFGWYAPLHLTHHAHPNQEGLDPDLPLFEAACALSPESAARARGLKRLVVRRQHWLFPFLVSLQVFALKCYGIEFLLTRKSRFRWIEAGLMLLHYALYFWFFVHYLGPLRAAGVFLVQYLTAGIHISAVLIPNHIGRPLLHDERGTFLERQMIPTRNVLTPPMWEGFWGSLNHHHEHHLFPSMSRDQVRRAAPLLREFCREANIEYFETTFAGCYREVFRSLRRSAGGARTG